MISKVTHVVGSTPQKSNRKQKGILIIVKTRDGMLKDPSNTDTNRKIIRTIFFILILFGIITIPLNRQSIFRNIDERSDWISSTYHAEAGGCKFSFNSEYYDPPVRMKVEEDGWYNITFYYFNGSTESKNVYVGKGYENITGEWWGMPGEPKVSEGRWARWSDGLFITLISIKDGEFPVLNHGAKNVEKIKVNGDVGYFTTSWKDIEVDTGKFLNNYILLKGIITEGIFI